MFARVVACLVAVGALGAAFAQAADIYVDVVPDNSKFDADPEPIEKRRLSDLARQLDAARADVLLLYTEYTAEAGRELKGFLRNISSYADEAVNAVEDRPNATDHGGCRSLFDLHVRKINLNTYRAASFSGENHHKFILGHMVVFRMHINKTDEYIKKCDRALHECGSPCEAKPRVKRWKRLAAAEIHRIQDDLQHTRRSYKDLVAHARKRLLHLKKQLTADITAAVKQYQKCLENEVGHG